MSRRILMALVAAAALLPGSSAFAAPTGGHCPPPRSGFITWDTSTEPYQADNKVDLMGNGNGVVCAKPVDNQTFVLDGVTYQIYNFIDDVVR